ncbi:MAG: hypothetical protein INR71_05075, partial [Terriglobus roseus]|nr:hypothetical protein [Terriglobus roseus]
MTAAQTTAAPVLSTPDTHVFEQATPTVLTSSLPRPSDEQLHVTYEIERTLSEIRAHRWRRIALQFPDEMLRDAPRVHEGLTRGLRRRRAEALRDEGEKEGEKEAEEKV